MPEGTRSGELKYIEPPRKERPEAIAWRAAAKIVAPKIRALCLSEQGKVLNGEGIKITLSTELDEWHAQRTERGDSGRDVKGYKIVVRQYAKSGNVNTTITCDAGSRYEIVFVNGEGLENGTPDMILVEALLEKIEELKIKSEEPVAKQRSSTTDDLRAALARLQ